MSILNSIGNTPLAEAGRGLQENSRVQILAKLEGSNPGGSVKDRAALFMIREALADGRLVPGKTILEPTSGNTGIALAMIASALGFPVRLCMPDCVSLERRLILQAMGAELDLTPGGEKTDGAIRAARRLLQSEPERFFMPDQFANPGNPAAHYQTTAPEIARETAGEFEIFVAGIGSGGTLMGCSRYFREHHPGIRIIGVEPEPGHSVQGLKNLAESATPEIFRREALDDIVTVSDAEAFFWTRRLCQSGFFVGISSGAAFAGAIRVAASIKAGRIVTIFPDRGDRYLSTTLFRSFCASCRP